MMDTGSSQVFIQTIPQTRRCLYPSCNKILSNTFRKDQKYCNSYCGSLDRKLKGLNKSKEETKIRQNARLVYDSWIKAGTPIYKIAELYEACQILFEDKKNLAEIRKARVLYSSKYNKKHSQQYKSYQREHKHIILRLKFAKFWDRIENETTK